MHEPETLFIANKLTFVILNRIRPKMFYNVLHVLDFYRGLLFFCYSMQQSRKVWQDYKELPKA